jgi:hypothetical protein
VHLVGFIIRKLVTMHGHMNVKFTQEVNENCNQYAFGLTPECQWDLRSSGILRSADWSLFTDVSGHCTWFILLDPFRWGRYVVSKFRCTTSNLPSANPRRPKFRSSISAVMYGALSQQHIPNLIWYGIWYDIIWYDMIWYDVIWYDIWYDMIWYDIFINCSWVATQWQ